MKKWRIIACGLFLAAVLLAMIPAATGAQEALELTADYTRLEGASGGSFEFQVSIKYSGKEARTFDLAAAGPGDWTTVITPRFSRGTRIGNIRLEPDIRQTVVVQATVPPNTAPGTYGINFQVTDTDLQASLRLEVVITARYDLWLNPASGLFSTRIKAGQDNTYTLNIHNLGTAAISNITFSGSSKPLDWTVAFSPDRISSLAAGQQQTVTANIRPPENTAPGDYQITISAQGNETRSKSLDVRVTVESPSIWGWIGIGVVVLFVIALIFLMLRLGRK